MHLLFYWRSRNGMFIDRANTKLYFSFHTLKGLTAMVGFENTSKFCHYFESFLDKAKDQTISPEQQDDFMRLLFDSLDLLRSILKRIKDGDMTDIEKAEELTEIFNRHCWL